MLSKLTLFINEQNRQIENLNEKLTHQISTMSILQNNVEVLHEHCLKLQKDINSKCEELEQYCRRQCLWIEGIVKQHHSHKKRKDSLETRAKQHGPFYVLMFRTKLYHNTFFFTGHQNVNKPKTCLWTHILTFL